MKMRVVQLLLVVAAVGLLGHGFAQPAWGFDALGRPSAVLQKHCHQVDDVRVCAMNAHGQNLPQIQIIYSGYLAKQDDGGVVVWLSLNGADGFFHMKRSETHPQYELWLGAPARETPCRIGDEASVAPIEAQLCPPGTPGNPGDLRWIVEGPPDEQAILFSRVRDLSGQPVSWDVQGAFVSVDGRRWDSRYGSNYRFTFEAGPARGR
jgi:hypothetical protein